MVDFHLVDIKWLNGAAEILAAKGCPFFAEQITIIANLVATQLNGGGDILWDFEAIRKGTYTLTDQQEIMCKHCIFSEQCDDGWMCWSRVAVDAEFAEDIDANGTCRVFRALKPRDQSREQE